MSASAKHTSVIVVYGVSGSGKSTVARLLSEKLSVPYYDADDFHPKSNVDKMRSGIPLQDDDRYPWLQALADQIKLWTETGGAVLACSALKEHYRKMLQAKVRHIHWVLLSGSFTLIKSRMEARKAHYMKTSLLQSQFDTLEVPDYGLKITVDKSPEEIVTAITKKLSAYG